MGDIYYLYPRLINKMTEQELRNIIEAKCKSPEGVNPAEMAEYILNLMGREFPFPIGKLARALGFKVELQTIPNDNLSGYIACDNSLKEGPRLIRLNERDSLGHQRFTIAHELWHYFENIKEVEAVASTTGYYSSYRTDLANDPTEQIANTFAANLLMPQSEYVSSYELLRSATPEHELNEKMSVIFGVSETAINIRNKALLRREVQV